jgi:hypothetical protein
MNIFDFIKNWFEKRKEKKRFDKRIKEISKRDPFIYRH